MRSRVSVSVLLPTQMAESCYKTLPLSTHRPCHPLYGLKMADFDIDKHLNRNAVTEQYALKKKIPIFNILAAF